MNGILGGMFGAGGFDPRQIMPQMGSRVPFGSDGLAMGRAMPHMLGPTGPRGQSGGLFSPGQSDQDMTGFASMNQSSHPKTSRNPTAEELFRQQMQSQMYNRQMQQGGPPPLYHQFDPRVNPYMRGT